MKKPKYLFEPPTEKQMRYLWFLAAGRTHRLYKMCVNSRERISI